MERAMVFSFRTRFWSPGFSEQAKRPWLDSGARNCWSSRGRGHAAEETAKLGDDHDRQHHSQRCGGDYFGPIFCA